MCFYCNDKGYVTAIMPKYVSDTVIDYEFAVKCTCSGGTGNNWKYPKDMKINDKEQVIYEKLISGKNIKEAVPW